MAFEKSNQKMCKLLAKVGVHFSLIAFVNHHLGDDVMMDDVMIEESWCHDSGHSHWLLIAMWHADDVINYMIGKSDKFGFHRKNTKYIFMNEMDISEVRTDSSDDFPVS